MIVSSYYKHQIKTILVRKRREVIPADPKFMTDIDLTLPVFLYQDGESVVKGEQVLSDGRRIILFTTKEHLKILARARQILGDGTFRITPGLWTQTFIISAEVSLNCPPSIHPLSRRGEEDQRPREEDHRSG